ncbi:MAG TPA: hydroxymethylglutaryl-CoA lyase [Acidimicrobiales bacterium]|nr:hydroxymethylglutaryl-CoA lyase [Acidimicrobiales bacterium]
MTAVGLRDVTLRDGLQDEMPISTEAKLAIFDALVRAGVTDLELTSFTRPDRVPAMADADQLAHVVLARGDGPRLWGLVLNRRGAERAVAAGLRHLQFVLSVSEAHNQENAGRSVADSLVELQAITALAADAGAQVEVTLATAFGCPFDGPVDPARVGAVAEQIRGLGVANLSVADTIGTAVPTEVTALVEHLLVRLTPIEIGVHLHDTRGLAMANALAGIAAGAARVDGALGGLGGCPFAPGASGNLALEDLVHALHAMGVKTGIDTEDLLDASFLACGLVGRRPTSHLSVAGPRFARQAAPRG